MSACKDKGKQSTDESVIKEEISSFKLGDTVADESLHSLSPTNGKAYGTLSVVGNDQGLGNLEENVMGGYNQVLFCKDPVYGISYYINYGSDYYIYAWKDDASKKELVVELPANQLFCMEGKLYFVLQSYDIYRFEGMEQGYILCYDPVTGEVAPIIEDTVLNLETVEVKIFIY